MTVTPLEALPLAQLRRRQSAKWRAYPDDVLPLFVAETDFALAPAITARLSDAVALGDTGYAVPGPALGEAYAGFAQRRFGWHVDPAGIRTTADVMTAAIELMRAALAPGDGVVITPPVYPPFTSGTQEAQMVPVPIPLRGGPDVGWSLDLDGIDAALAAGARAVLLCNPHNPTGTVHARADLARLADIAAAHGALVISDEIHAPLGQPDAGFTPFLAASPTAAEVGICLTSASKAFNLAGLKCALIVSGARAAAAVVDTLPPEIAWRAGQFGALATQAAFTDGDAWLDALLARLDVNRHLLADLLAEHLPRARYRVPDAGYLGWVDLSAYGWGEDPAAHILTDARVAFQSGPTFGAEGAGHVRINFGCAPEVLREALERTARLVSTAG